MPKIKINSADIGNIINSADASIVIDISAKLDYLNPPSTTEEEILRRYAQSVVNVSAKKYNKTLEMLVRKDLGLV